MYWCHLILKKASLSIVIFSLGISQFLINLAIAQHSIPSPNESTLGKFLGSSDTFQAGFRQDLYDNQGNLISRSFGSVFILRPNKFLWNYSDPYEQILLADGNRIWFYDKDLNQVTVMPQDDKLYHTPAYILSEASSDSDTFSISSIYLKNGIEWFEIDFGSQQLDIRAFFLGFESDSLKELNFLNSLGQKTHISFFDVSVETNISKDIFIFDLPQDADLIGSLEDD
tara:strand:- start:46094 stop:46774 length:681 start_codon:yes stop_codon:yes gene_type:complete